MSSLISHAFTATDEEKNLEPSGEVLQDSLGNTYNLMQSKLPRSDTKGHHVPGKHPKLRFMQQLTAPKKEEVEWGQLPADLPDPAAHNEMCYSKLRMDEIVHNEIERTQESLPTIDDKQMSLNNNDAFHVRNRHYIPLSEEKSSMFNRFVNSRNLVKNHRPRPEHLFSKEAQPNKRKPLTHLTDLGTALRAPRVQQFLDMLPRVTFSHTVTRTPLPSSSSHRERPHVRSAFDAGRVWTTKDHNLSADERIVRAAELNSSEHNPVKGNMYSRSESYDNSVAHQNQIRPSEYSNGSANIKNILSGGRGNREFPDTGLTNEEHMSRRALPQNANLDEVVKQMMKSRNILDESDSSNRAMVAQTKVDALPDQEGQPELQRMNRLPAEETTVAMPATLAQQELYRSMNGVFEAHAGENQIQLQIIPDRNEEPNEKQKKKIKKTLRASKKQEKMSRKKGADAKEVFDRETKSSEARYKDERERVVMRQEPDVPVEDERINDIIEIDTKNLDVFYPLETELNNIQIPLTPVFTVSHVEIK